MQLKYGEITNDEIERIAIVCHQSNKAYCESIGDVTQLDWDDAPSWQKDSALQGVIFHLGANRAAEASHASWMKLKVSDGWVYGPVKDVIAKTHPCIVPFDQLPSQQKMKDYLFRGIVHSFKDFFNDERRR